MTLYLRFVGQGLLRRWGSALLTVTVGALALSALMLILWAQSAVPEAVKARISETDMVIGPKGSGLDLSLCCALHLTAAGGLVDPEQVRARLSQEDVRPYIKAQVPIAMGDNYQGQRIVWTTPEIVPFYIARLSQGGLFKDKLQLVAGSQAAQMLKLKVGDRLASSHGFDEDGEAHEAQYSVTGILAPTGGVLDHLLLADLSSIAAVHDDAESHEDHDPHHKAAALRVNAVLVRFTSPIAQASVPLLISQSDTLTAASPRLELAKLMALVRPLMTLITVIASGLGAVAVLILILTLIQGLNRRARDLSLLRFLGMSRLDLAVLSLVEAVIVAHLAFIASLILTLAGMAFTQAGLSGYGLSLDSPLPVSMVVGVYAGVWMLSLLAITVPVSRLILTHDDEGLRA